MPDSVVCSVQEESSPVRIVLTGSECTGKSTLAALLAEHYGVPYVEEYLREYFEAKNGVLTLDDAVPIAEGQLLAEDVAEAHKNQLVLMDTNILSSVVYNKHYYDLNPEWIEEAFAQRQYSLYLLCGIDVPWEADGQRDMPAQREYMQSLFRDELQRRNLPYVELSGSVDERFNKAIELINALL